MKPLFAVLVILLCAVRANTQTSVYHPMADTGATWCETYTWGLCGATEHHVLRISGDTVIGQHTYHKILADGYQYCNSPPSYFTNSYRGAFREDTATRIVYWQEPNSTTEFMRYDFSLGVGDTMHGYYGLDAIITSMDSVLIGTDYRKRWWINSGLFMDSGSVVEGIGSSFGLYMWDWQGVESLSHLNSYAEFGADLWQPDSTAYCPIITGNVLNIDFHPEVQVMPNPTAGQFTVHYEYTEPYEVLMELRDVSGRIVSSQTKKDAREFDVQFDCEFLPDGIYFLRVITGEETSTQKVVIRHY